MPPESRTRSELDVLAAVERGEVVTQMALTKRVGISIGLVNALLKRAIRKGYVKTRQVPYKRYAYYVTPKGFSEKSRLVAEYLDKSLQFFRQARSQYADLIAAARQRGCPRIILVGGGELAEIAVLAARGEDVTVVAIVDPGANDRRRYGLPVVRAADEAEAFDAALITDIRTPQETYEALCRTLAPERVLAPPLLKITSDRADLIVAVRQAGLQG